jgi:hypothetical protein
VIMKRRWNGATNNSDKRYKIGGKSVVYGLA